MTYTLPRWAAAALVLAAGSPSKPLKSFLSLAIVVAP